MYIPTSVLCSHFSCEVGSHALVAHEPWPLQHRHGSSLQSPILPFYYVLQVEPGELPSRQQRDGRAERQQEPSIIGEEVAERVVMSALGRSRFSYSITSSARASNVGGTLRPRARAVGRFIANTNLADCTTGKSAGFSPLMIRPA